MRPPRTPLVPSFVTRLNLSSFASGSSLRAESSLSGVSCLLYHGFGSCPLVFGILPLLGSLLSFLLLFVEWVSPLLRRVFLGVSLLLFVACWRLPSALVLFLFLLSAAFSSWGFSQHAFYTVSNFSCSVQVRLQLCSPFHLFIVISFLIVGGVTLVSSLASSLRSSASLLQCLLGRCAWSRHLSPMVRCVHGIASLARSHIGCYI